MHRKTERKKMSLLRRKKKKMEDQKPFYGKIEILKKSYARPLNYTGQITLFKEIGFLKIETGKTLSIDKRVKEKYFFPLSVIDQITILPEPESEEDGFFYEDNY